MSSTRHSRSNAGTAEGEDIVGAVTKTESQLARIARLNPQFRAFTTVDAAGARHRAAAIDEAEVGGRWLGLLHGVTIAVKDNIDTTGIRTAAGSALFAERVPNA